MSQAAVTIQQVGEIQKRNNLPIWKIFAGSKTGTEIDANESNTNIDDSIQLLQNTLNGLIGDKVIVCLYSHKLERGKAMPIAREMIVQLNSTKSNSYQGMNGIPIEQWIKDRDAIAELKMQNTLLLQKMEAEKNDTGTKSFLGTIAEAASTKIPDLMDLGIKAAHAYLHAMEQKKNGQAISAPNKTAGARPTEIEVEANNELVGALENWMSVDPDFIAAVKKISELAKQEPEKYSMYKSMLLK